MFFTQASYIPLSCVAQFGISARVMTPSPPNSMIGAQSGTAPGRSGSSLSSAVNRNRPPGLSTRAISAKTAIRSAAKKTASAQTAPSMLSASNPVAAMSPIWNRAHPGGTNTVDRSAAYRIPAGDQSSRAAIRSYCGSLASIRASSTDRDEVHAERARQPEANPPSLIPVSSRICAAGWPTAGGQRSASCDTESGSRACGSVWAARSSRATTPLPASSS